MPLRPGTEVNPLTTLPLPSLPDLLPHTCSHVTAPPDSAHSIFLLCEAAFAGGLMLVHIPFYVTDLFPTEHVCLNSFVSNPVPVPKNVNPLLGPLTLPYETFVMRAGRISGRQFMHTPTLFMPRLGIITRLVLWHFQTSTGITMQCI